MRLFSALLLLLAVCYSNARLNWTRLAGPRGALKLSKNERFPRIGADFNYLMLTRIYPMAVCRADQDAVPGSCEIPTGTPSWSIHGLWPNYANGSYPQFCDGIPKKFDPKLIEPIQSRLITLWPNLFPSKTADSFWKHEWEKHGTCGESDSRLGSEILYFQSTMDLNALHSVDDALRSAGVEPREQPYHKAQLQEALNAKLGRGHHVQINCLKDKKTGLSLLGDVRMCFSRLFQLVDCPLTKSSQPVTELLGVQVPLPSFRSCPDLITYLHESSYHSDSIPPHFEVLYYVNPLIDLYTRLAYRKNGVVSVMTPVVIVCLAVLLVRYYRPNARHQAVRQY